MAEGLATPDGTSLGIGAAVEGEEGFAAAMAAPEPDSIPAPPKKDPDAPYGRTKDGMPKKGPGGRPARDKAEQPRVTTTAAAQPAASLPDYEAKLNELAFGMWQMLALTAPTRPQATLLKLHKPGLVRGLALGAVQNDRVRGVVDWITEEVWMVVLAGAVIPFAMQSVALWTKPERLAMSKEDLEAIAVQDLIEVQAAAEEQMRAAAEASMAA